MQLKLNTKEQMVHKFAQKVNQFWFGLISLLTIVIYIPSLFHLPRSDQLLYLYYVAGKSRWVDLIFGTYDFNRTRVWQGGDIFFRPLVYFFLGSEKYVFGYNFMLWQLTGIILHLIVVWFLIKLLLKIHPGRWAYLLSALFSTFLIIFEMVIFHHINAYLIFNIAMLIALNVQVEIYQTKVASSKSIFILFFALMVACFTYELGCIYCLLLALFLALDSKDCTWSLFGRSTSPWLGLFIVMLPCWLYFSGSGWNLLGKEYLWEKDPNAIAEAFSVIGTFVNFLSATCWWGITGILSSSTTVYLMNRTEICLENPLNFLKSDSGVSPLILLPILLQAVFFFFYGWLFFKGLKPARMKQNRLLILLFVSIVMIFILAIVVGRANVGNGLSKIQINSYYSYFFWLYFLPLLYLMPDLRFLANYCSARIKRIATALMIAMIILNSSLVFSMNYIRAKEYVSWRLFVNHLNHLIQQEKGNPDFSFWVVPDAKHNPYLKWVKLTDAPDNQGVTYFDLLYPGYMKPDSPQYRYTLSKENFSVVDLGLKRVR